MAKAKTLAKWIEMSQGFIHNKPPMQKDWEAFLFINNVELRETESGRKYLLRSTNVQPIPAQSKEEMEAKIQKFMLREDVRLLAKGLDSNDFDQLPQRANDPDQAVIDGTADIYDFAEEPCSANTRSG